MSPELWMEMGSTGVVAILLVMMFKYLTKDLSGELSKQYDIIVKLIDKVNDLKDTINSKWKA